MASSKPLQQQIIYGLNNQINEELNNIASNIGISKSRMIRNEIRDRLSEMDTRYGPNQNSVNVFVTGVSPDLKSKIRRVARDIGITPNALIKILVYQMVGNEPDNMKLPNKGLDI